MKQKAWNVPPHLRDRSGDIERLKATIAEKEYSLARAKEDLELMRRKMDAVVQTAQSARRNSARYNRLRKIGVVVMDDECKHLQGEAMDKYLDSEGRALSELGLLDMLQQRMEEMAYHALTANSSARYLQKGDSLTISFGDITFTK